MKITISQEGCKPITISTENLDVSKDAIVCKNEELLKLILSNKDKIKNAFLKVVLDYYKSSKSDYGNFAEEEIGKKISDCTIKDMDSMLYGKLRVYGKDEISRVNKIALLNGSSKEKIAFVLGSNCKLDPDHGIAVGFDDAFNPQAVGDYGSFF